MDQAEVRTWIGVPATALGDGDLARIIAACAADQAARCTWPRPHDDVGDELDDRPPALQQALLRRVQREVAARNLPLGLVGIEGAEFGPSMLPRLDALIEEHERPYRTQVLA